MEAGDVVSILGVDHVFYDDTMLTGGSAAWKNNNPGNITWGNGAAATYGAYSDKHNDRFAIFPDVDTGYQGIKIFVRSKGALSLIDLMRLYAPDGDGPNDSTGYATQIANNLGVSVDTTTDTLDDDQLNTVADTIKQVEGTIEGDTYTPDSLPQDVADWLAANPSRSERETVDQPFASTKSPRSEGIKNIQSRLNDLGYTPPLTVDGAYGPASAAAAKWFQANHGVTPDGVFGNQSWIALVNA